MTIVMGVLNVTPDSFSDGGRYASVAAAVETGLEMAAHGAAWVDVGGESTRPGAQRVPLEVELERVVPVVEGLTEQGVAVSIDTTRATVARTCVTAGAGMVNDVSGGLADPEMLTAVAQLEVDYIAMHWRAHSAQMENFTGYDDVVREVAAALQERLAACIMAGMDPARVILDPGLGFAKQTHHNWELLAGLQTIMDIGPRVLVGASRKRFLGALLARGDQPRPVDERDDATTAVTTLAALADVWGVRVHDVRASADAIQVVRAWQEAR
jgi:dihydropteroate synthase